MIYLIPLLQGILGRLTGSDFPFTHKWVTSAVTGGIFYLWQQDWKLSLIVFIGLLLAEVKRDSLFDISSFGWDNKKALYMTYKALWYAPLFIGVGIYLNAILLPTFLLRSPVQYVCKFIPFPRSRNHKGTFLQKFIGGRAECYEFLYNIVIGIGLVFDFPLGGEK